jgi:transcriptional regulator with XRE-family HTH domain
MVVVTLARTGFSSQLVMLREQHDPPLNQQEAADLIGLSLRQYGRLERAEANATLATIRKIADAYGVEPHILTGADDDRLTATRQTPTVADFARLEAKLDALLDHFDLLTIEEGVPARTPDLVAVLSDDRDGTPTPPAHPRHRPRQRR